MSFNCFGSSQSIGGRQPRRKASQSQHSEESKRNCYVENFILIPYSVMFNNEPFFDEDIQTDNEQQVKETNSKITYKLINGVPSGTKIRKRKSYVMSYNDKTKNAEWVYEILNKSTLPRKEKKGAKEDQNSLKQMTFGTNKMNDKDYDQGHLAAAANHTWCMEAYHDTYLISNMAPMFKSLNTGAWKILENYCRDLVMKDEDAKVRNVHVYTGPLYLSEKEESIEYKSEILYYRPCESDPGSMERLGGKIRPTDFFKVVIVENNDETVEEPEFYRMPNYIEKVKKNQIKKKPKEIEELEKLSIKEKSDFLKLYETNIDIIEKQSGLKFIVSRPNGKMHMKPEMFEWKGEDGEGNSCCVTITAKRQLAT